MKKIIMILLVLFLCSCTKEVPVEEGHDLGGLTYYSSSDEYDAADPANVWFGKDHSFVMRDNFYDGFYEISGTWEVKEDVATLTVEETGVGTFKKILFEIKDDQLVLKTTLAGSQADTVFTLQKPEPSAPVIDPVQSGTTYYRVNDGISFLRLNDDGTFLLSETVFGQTHEVKGLYGKQGDVYMFSNFDVFKDFKGENVYNFEFQIYDDQTLIAMEDLYETAKKDIFTVTGTLPDHFNEGEVFNFKSRFIRDEGDIYSPVIEFDSQGNFVFTENLLAGMGTLKGHYEMTSNGYICHVDQLDFKGFAGDDTQIIEFEYVDMVTLRLKTTICSSMEGDLFHQAD